MTKIIALAVVVILVVGILTYLRASTEPGVNEFAPGSIVKRVAPGTVGCRLLAGNLCFSFSFITQFQGKTLSDIQFNVDNESDGNPHGPALTLGLGANVSVISGNSTVTALWNVTTQTWERGSTIGVPYNTVVPVVLDTGLSSNTTIANGMFWISLGSSSVGGPLFP
jgi:hypothetical protein